MNETTPPPVLPKKLAHTITTVLQDPEMKKCAENLGTLMQEENRVRKALSLIEDHYAS
jgi:UDP:flavonoid glycosyltransferase YjiC (YdhE family)